MGVLKVVGGEKAVLGVWEGKNVFVGVGKLMVEAWVKMGV